MVWSLFLFYLELFVKWAAAGITESWWKEWALEWSAARTGSGGSRTAVRAMWAPWGASRAPRRWSWFGITAPRRTTAAPGPTTCGYWTAHLQVTNTGSLAFFLPEFQGEIVRARAKKKVARWRHRLICILLIYSRHVFSIVLLNTEVSPGSYRKPVLYFRSPVFIIKLAYVPILFCDVKRVKMA